MGLVDYLATASYTTCTLTALVILIAYSYISRKPWINLPPGPPVIPILGSLPFMGGTDIHKILMKMRRKYGDIYTISLGYETAVLINGYDLIKEALVNKQKVMSGRPKVFALTSIGRNRGIAFTEGEMWKKNREQMMRYMKVFGYGKQDGMGVVIQTEVERLVHEMKKLCSKPINMQPVLMRCTCNIISVMCFNKVFDHNDKDFNRFLADIHETAEFFGHPINYFPYLRFIPGDIFGFKNSAKKIDNLLDYSKRQITERKQRLKDGEEPIDVVGLYMQELDKQQKTGIHTVFSETELAHNVFALYAGGTDTSAVTMTWGMLYMILYPNIQEKVFAEINDVVGTGRLPTPDDRLHMPYTNATICEIQRYSDIATMGAPHSPTEDVTIRGYTIPKGMMVFPVQHTTHYDPAVWKNPAAFDPTNFLDDNGKFVPSPKLIPFSMGPRMCFGEVVAKAEMFILFATLIQKFRFSKPDGAPDPDLSAPLSMPVSPKPYDLAVTER